MAVIYSLSEAVRVADARVTGFTGLYRVVLAAEALFGLALLIVPGWMTEVFALKEGAYTAVWGAFLLWSVLFQVPGVMNPVHSRLPVVIGVVGRYLVAIVYLTQALWLPAIVTAAFALGLNVVYYRMVLSVLMSRP